jgi:hypothetical protein
MKLPYTKALPALMLALAGGMIPVPSWACASCGCTLSSDWEGQGLSNTSGLKMDLRYDYLDQNQLRHSADTISPNAALALGAPEIERYTRNQYTTLSLDYTSHSNLGVTLIVPYINRVHETWGDAGISPPAQPGYGAYHSDMSNLGDVKLIGYMHPLADNHNFGVMLGLKLPTGSHSEMGTRLPGSSDSGVNVPGSAILADAGLQPGTGTTDLILGVFYHDALNRDWDYFSQAVYQYAFMGPMDSYRPGNGLNFNLGARYMSLDNVIPQLQLNMRNVKVDSGALSDTISTGGTLVYFSPGLSVQAGEKTSLYGFIQLPLYQNVIGYQLVPRATFSVGLHHAF